MKNVEETKQRRFDLVKGHHLTAIANKVECKYSYVYMILNGLRPANTALAKKVIVAAEIIQASLEKAEVKMVNKLNSDCD